METSHRCCSKQKVKKGFWTPEEDEKLITHITIHGHSSWSSVPNIAGLERCGKSCRLRWVNYLRPNLKKGIFTPEEEQIIIDVHRIIGNKWAQIAKHIPGRTDNEVKNFWNSCVKKKLISLGLDPNTHNLISSSTRHQLTPKASNFMIDFTKRQEVEEEDEPNSVFSVLGNINPQISTVLNSTSTVSAEIIINPNFVTSLPADHVQPIQTMDDQNHYPTASLSSVNSDQNKSLEFFPNYQYSQTDIIPNMIFSNQFIPFSFSFSSSSSSSCLEENCLLGTTTNNPFEPNRFVLDKSTQQLENINIGKDKMLWENIMEIEKWMEDSSTIRSQQDQDMGVSNYDYEAFDSHLPILMEPTLMADVATLDQSRVIVNNI